jgi:hypothetical protein
MSELLLERKPKADDDEADEELAPKPLPLKDPPNPVGCIADGEWKSLRFSPVLLRFFADEP